MPLHILYISPSLIPYSCTHHAEKWFAVRLKHWQWYCDFKICEWFTGCFFFFLLYFPFSPHHTYFICLPSYCKQGTSSEQRRYIKELKKWVTCNISGFPKLKPVEKLVSCWKSSLKVEAGWFEELGERHPSAMFSTPTQTIFISLSAGKERRRASYITLKKKGSPRFTEIKFHALWAGYWA